MDNNRQSGFTLLELVIAMSVFSVGIMAAFTLALANINISDENYQRILSANLAREGIEVVKNIRDTNWLKIEANVDCDSLTAGTQICTWDQGLDQWSTSTVDYDQEQLLQQIGVDVETCYADNTCRLYRTSDNYYTHTQTDNSSTNLARVINIKSICKDYDGDSVAPDSDIVVNSFSCSGAGDWEKKVGIQVKSTVVWHRGTKTEQVEILNNLYNWQDYVDYD